MHTHQPLVSIIIPTYNRAHLIGETLDSVLAQTYPHWECIVVDDGSADHTDEVVGTYVQKDARFRYYHRPDSHKTGGNGARNFGFEVSRGDFLVFLDSDDLLMESCLRGRVEQIENHEADMYLNPSGLFKNQIGDHHYLWNRLRPEENTEQLLIRFLNTDMPWSILGVTWRRAFFIRTNGWDDRLIAWQDWDLHVRALMLKPIRIVSTEVDHFVRLAHSNSIGKKGTKPAYYKSIQIALRKLYENMSLSSDIYKNHIECFESFKIQNLIFLPLDRNLKKTPYIFILERFYFSPKYRLKFAWIYVVQLANKSTRLRKLFFKKIADKQREKHKNMSTYLKVHKDMNVNFNSR